MKTPIEVRLVGPTLLCQAIEALLVKVSPIFMESGTGAAETGDYNGDSGASAMRRRPPQGTTPSVILLIGEGWQQRVLAESRLPRRGGASAGGSSAVNPRYALIADGNKIDFYGARKMAVNAFIGTDEPLSVLVQGIQAAAQNRLYCSPQLLPALINAVGSTGPGGLADNLTDRSTEPTNSNNAAKATGEGAVEETAPASQAALLSAREHEVALHAARGLSNEQIAVFLGISVPTVKFHLMHAFRKLSIQRRTQLYAFMPYLTSATEALLPPGDD